MHLDRGSVVLEPSTLMTGITVQWIVQGEGMAECGSRIALPSLNLDFALHPGANVIEFTPSQAGAIPWRCEAGGIQGVFQVQEATSMMHPGHGNGHEAPANPTARIIQELIEKSASAIEELRRRLHP
jgi:plastocyanin domain-containing protein